jgi:hypothetical protein
MNHAMLQENATACVKCRNTLNTFTMNKTNVFKHLKTPTFTAYVVKENAGQIQLEVTITSDNAIEMLNIGKALTESGIDLYSVTTNSVISKHNAYIDHMVFNQYAVVNSNITNRNKDVITKISIWLSSNDDVTKDTDHLYKESVIGTVLERLTKSLGISPKVHNVFKCFEEGKWY